MCNKAAFWLTTLLLTVVCFSYSDPQLLINVKNQGGDVMRESITANVTDDTVLLEFLRSDGVFISQLMDFSNEVQVLKAIIPGEEELGQSGYQVLCFLRHADKTQFIAADAMVKLRQKNPGTIRTAEEERGAAVLRMGAWVAGALRQLSPQAQHHCADARDAVYARSDDLERWAARHGAESTWLATGVTPFPVSAEGREHSTCTGERDAGKECWCHLDVCINWYPCGLKYCKGKPQGGAGLSYRCGIKTCRQCQRLEYLVRRKLECVWDE